MRILYQSENGTSQTAEIKTFEESMHYVQMLKDADTFELIFEEKDFRSMQLSKQGGSTLVSIGIPKGNSLIQRFSYDVIESYSPNTFERLVKDFFEGEEEFDYIVWSSETEAEVSLTSAIGVKQSIEKQVSKGGCYVATAVYGSYDCPQVWTLRRYRDNTLAETWYGRAFIKTYYTISPTLVKWFGKTNWFKKMWQSILDRMVAKLQADGVESIPYEDKKW